MPSPSTFLNNQGGSGGTGGTGGGAAPQLFSGSGAPAATLGLDADRYIDVATFDIYVKAGGAWGLSGSLRGAPGAPGLNGVAAPGGILSGAIDPGANEGADGQFFINTVSLRMFFKSAGAWDAGTSLVGPQGPSNGREIYSGAGAPAGALGKDGDGYLDTATGAVHVKAAGVWALTGTSLLGPRGFDVLVGNGAPGIGLGRNGEHYLDQQTGQIYARAADVWSLTGSSLKGPAGPAGGLSVLTGNGPPNDANGNNGDTYIDRQDRGAVYVKNAGTWIPTADHLGGVGILVGQGAPLSADGTEGDSYVDLNDNGRVHIKSAGVWIATTNFIAGPPGAPGANGADGVDGVDGANAPGGILHGAINPDAGVGVDGQSYINTATQVIFHKAAGVWDAGTSIIGPQGPAGAQGPAGPAGNGDTIIAGQAIAGGATFAAFNANVAGKRWEIVAMKETDPAIAARAVIHGDPADPQMDPPEDRPGALEIIFNGTGVEVKNASVAAGSYKIAFKEV